MITISCTIPIIQSRRAILPGLRAIALFRIKRIGILSAASFAFTRFTENRSSKNDSDENRNARESVTARTSSASGTSPGTVAAKSAAGPNSSETVARPRVGDGAIDYQSTLPTGERVQLAAARK